jgi:polysaccharide biosynthesis transport protein
MDNQLALPGPSTTLSRIHETSAKFQRYKVLLRRRWWFLLLTASIGVCFQALTISNQAQQYVSLAKLVAGGRMGSNMNGGPQYIEYLQDFYGTIIETLESPEMHKHAEERVRALSPDLKPTEVDVRVTQNKGSAIFNVAAFGTEPKFTRVFLDALLDEFRAFRDQIREQQRNKALTALAEDVVKRETELKQKAEELTNFKKNNNVVVLNEGQNQSSQILRQLTVDKNRKTMELVAYDMWLKDVNSSMQQRERNLDAGTSPGIPTAPAAPTGGTVANGSQELTSATVGQGFTSAERDSIEYRRKIRALKGDRAELLNSLRPQHPSVLEVDQRIAKEETMLKTIEDEIKDQWMQHKADLERNIALLDTKIAEFTQKATDDGRKLAEHERLQKSYDESERAHKEKKCRVTMSRSWSARPPLWMTFNCGRCPSPWAWASGSLWAF